MFTGIIEAAGRITAIRRGAGDMSIDVDTAGAIAGPVMGESVAVDGVCLTVVAASGPVLTFDVSRETVARTAFKEAAVGRKVNIERAMRLGDRLGGHLVSGHVDTVGRLSRITPSGEGYEIEVELPADGMKYVIEKGSIAVDGISLTVASKKRSSVTVAVIPHTWRMTALHARNPNSTVNIEYDMIAKYVENFVNPSKSVIDGDFLSRHGF